jgi:hypothetical protein
MNKHFALVVWLASWVTFCATANSMHFDPSFMTPISTFYDANYAINLSVFKVPCPVSKLGLMDFTTAHGCVSDSISGIYDDLGEQIQMGQTRSFVIHTNATASLGTVFFMQKTPTFAFIPAQMTPGQTYFISPVAGPKMADGLVDLTDSCCVFGIGQPVVFHSAPVGIWATNGSVCAGDSVHLSVLLFGESPFMIHVFDNFLGEIDTFSTSNSLFDFNVNNTSSTSYTLLKVANDFCVSSPGTPVFVKVGQPATTVFNTKKLKICKNSAAMLPTFVLFHHLITSGDTTGNWVDLDNSGSLGLFPILEVTKVPLGKYRFQYTTAAAIAPCADSSYIIEIEIADCFCPALLMDTLPKICQTSTTLNLQNFTQNHLGSWSIIHQPVGSNIALSDSLFDVSSAVSGIYKFVFLFQNVPANVCAAADTMLLEVLKTVEAGQQTIPFLGKCAKNQAIIFLEKELENASSNGIWTANSPIDNPFLNKNTGKLSIENLEIGVHFFTKKIIAPAPCPTDSAIIQLEIFQNPVADAGIDGQFDCFHSTVSIGSLMPDSLVFLWSNPNFGDHPTLETGEAGNYFLTVTDAATGCFSVDSIQILANPGLPIFTKIFQKSPACFGENSGKIRVDSVAGGLAPFLYSIDNQPVSPVFSFEKLKARIFKLSVQDALGCETDTILQLLEPSKLALFAGADTVVLLGDSILLSPFASFKTDDFVWSGVGVGCPDCWSSVIAPKVDGAMILTAFDSSGCRAESHFSVEIRRDFSIYFPNILQPSNEVGGVNDQFFPQGAANGGFQIRRLSIRSRWGDLVFFTQKMPLNDPDFGWDGRIRGKIAPEGVYLWEAELQLSDGSILRKSGDLSVVR